MNNNPARFLLALIALGFSGSLSAQPPIMPAARPPNTAAPGSAKPMGIQPAVPAALPAYMTYTYYGERYRDPFVPLNGDFQSDSALDRPPQLISLSLKGIVQDANGRMALLTSGVSSYILRGGRLYDGRNRAVKKISGVIKTDSVVLIGADHTIRELRTKVTL
jgi:hypothetical protein